MPKYQEYNMALKIDNDQDLFTYGMKTNLGNAFVHGDLKAIDTVTYPEIGGSYSYVEKVKERYTRHTRTVTKTKKVNGKSKSYTTTETYWSWDRVDSWSKHCEKISFLGEEFDYNTITLPSSYYIDTKTESSHVRYVYYGVSDNYTGTIYTKLHDKTIDNCMLYNNMKIEEVIKEYESKWELVLFWLVWIVLTGFSVYGFYYADNYWLEDKKY